jgi:hypothetical protein
MFAAMLPEEFPSQPLLDHLEFQTHARAAAHVYCLLCDIQYGRYLLNAPGLYDIAWYCVTPIEHV